MYTSEEIVSDTCMVRVHCAKQLDFTKSIFDGNQVPNTVVYCVQFSIGSFRHEGFVKFIF